MRLLPLLSITLRCILQIERRDKEKSKRKLERAEQSIVEERMY